MKRVKSFIKKIGHVYVNSFNEMYGPMIKAGVTPWI